MNRKKRIILDIAVIVALVVSLLLPKNGNIRYFADGLRVLGFIGLALRIYFQAVKE